MYLGSRVKAGGRSKVGGDLSPISLFLTGAQGVWFDRQDLSSMYQDAAGTVPAAVNSPVGKCLDKSGRGNHATQGTAASRPILRQDASGRYYLEYDGVDDGMATAAIDFTGTDKMTAFAAAFKASDAAAGLILELGASTGLAANPGSFSIGSGATNGTDRQSWFAEVRGSGGGIDGTQPARQGRTYVAPVSSVLCGTYDLTQAAVVDEVGLRVNGGAPLTYTSAGTAAPGGKFANTPLYIGRRGGTTLPFNGRDYGLIVVGRTMNATEIARAERFLASRMGIAL